MYLCLVHLESIMGSDVMTILGVLSPSHNVTTKWNIV
jgi:hypothetical protein